MSDKPEDVLKPTADSLCEPLVGAAAPGTFVVPPGYVLIKVGTPLKEATDQYFQSVLSHVQGNKAAAAKLLGITRSSVYSRLAGKAIPESE